jgi:hypothetical protein
MWSPDGVRYYSGNPPANYAGPVMYLVPDGMPMPGTGGPQGPSAQPNFPQPERSAMIQPPPPEGPWVRAPFYPTAPFRSTSQFVGHQTRFYSAALVPADGDYAIGTEALRPIQFDIPCRLVARNGSCVDLTGALNFTGINPRDLFRIRFEYTTGDRLDVAARLASTVLGTGERPGEIGDVGWTIGPGASMVVGITPLFANLTIEVVLVCLETRTRTNVTRE